MQLSPKMRAFLDRLGVNTTRLQWKLYERERKRENRQRAGQQQLPSTLQWLRYPHKFCPKCRAVVDRSERVCPRCGTRVHSMAVYRAQRLLGMTALGGTATTVYLFLTMMVAVYLAGALLQGPSALFNPRGVTLFMLGAWEPRAVLFLGEYWRMLSFGLVHGGILHILFNGYALSQVGPVVEEEVGHTRMLVVITLTQLGAAVATHVWYLYVLGLAVPTVGASGWLFGLLGYGVGHYHRSGTNRELRNFFVQWIIYGILFGLLVRANNAAHIGGMLAGLALGLVPSQRRRWEHIWRPVWQGAFWISVGLWLFTLWHMASYVLAAWRVVGDGS